MEVKEIPENQTKKDQFKRFSDKMKAISDSADKEVQSSIKHGLDKTSKNQYFPSEFSTYLLDLKLSQNLPVSLLPDSLFEKPIFKGREAFFQRLASELISFGLAYQRVYLKPVPLYKITSLLHTHRPWWRCDIQDVEKSLSILKKNSLIQEDADGFTFEPFSISSEIRTFLASISDGINEYGEISITLVDQLLPWKVERIRSALEIRLSNRICIIDEDKQIVYFPGYQKRGKEIMFFNIPEVTDFFDNRVVISWKVLQPKDLPPLEEIIFKISGEPELVFEPDQQSTIEIPALEDNTVIINWVITRPKVRMEISLSLSCSTVEETQKIIFDP